MSNRVAVVGVGQTKYAAKRQDVSIAGLLREAAKRALDDAGMTWAEIDAVMQRGHRCSQYEMKKCLALLRANFQLLAPQSRDDRH